MIPSVQTFVENHIDEIDDDLVDFLANTAAKHLTEYQLENMIESFKKAGIPIDEYRKDALMILLDDAFDTYSLVGADNVTLIDWLPEYMKSFMGFSYVDIRVIVAKNQDRWKHIFTLIPWEEDGEPDAIMEKVK